jgi:uncharacterized protein YndB with AHSA1/START domain
MEFFLHAVNEWPRYKKGFFMKNKFSAKLSLPVNTPASEVWKALTDPALIKQWLHGTDAVSDWKAGSPLEFRGEWKGKPYADKGTILEIEKERLFKYSWWSSFSGLEDVPENYSTITYRLTPENGETLLELTQDNIATEDAKQASEKNWLAVLQTLKNLVEE